MPRGGQGATVGGEDQVQDTAVVGVQGQQFLRRATLQNLMSPLSLPVTRVLPSGDMAMARTWLV